MGFTVESWKLFRRLSSFLRADATEFEKLIGRDDEMRVVLDTVDRDKV